jgi:hypothetical protein
MPEGMGSGQPSDAATDDHNLVHTVMQPASSKPWVTDRLICP